MKFRNSFECNYVALGQAPGEAHRVIAVRRTDIDNCAVFARYQSLYDTPQLKFRRTQDVARKETLRDVGKGQVHAFEGTSDYMFPSRLPNDGGRELPARKDDPAERCAEITRQLPIFGVRGLPQIRRLQG